MYYNIGIMKNIIFKKIIFLLLCMMIFSLLVTWVPAMFIATFILGPEPESGHLLLIITTTVLLSIIPTYIVNNRLSY